ncbi:unnamed protein product [Closterium sp. NIES-64]|nr:unnamed protein product [Closterium sp. NIES-64]
MEIGAPFDVKHVVHVTFDRYKGFIGLPDELLAHVDAVPPSARWRGIFRIAAQMEDEDGVRSQLSSGVLPPNLDAWFRELPEGLLDLFTPNQVAGATEEAAATALAETLTGHPPRVVIDPMIGLQHAVRVMEFLRALVEKRRNERAAMGGSLPELTRAGADSTGAEGAGGQGG